MFCQATNTREKTWFWSLLLIASSVTARCAQRRKMERMGKDWGDTAFSGYCWCPWQLQGSQQWQPDPLTGWVPSVDRMGQGLTPLPQVKGKAAGEEGRRKIVGYRRNARRKSSCVPGQCPIGGTPFQSGFPLSVRNPHPVCCLEHQKDVRASKLQPDGSRGWCDTARWLGKCCLSSHGPLVHLVTKPAQQL